jgi:hypothetical protein
MAKDKDIRVRVSTEDKQLIVERAKERGFDSLSAYLLFLIREDLKK